MRSYSRGVLAAALGLTLALPALAANAAAPPDPQGYDRVLDRPTKGPAALRALTGPERSEVASRNGMSEQRLAKVLEDPTAGLGREGKLFYAEQWTDEPNPAGTVAVSEAASLNEAETFSLHSKPDSNLTIYLDFNGYSLPSGVAWRDSIGAGPFDAFDEREAGGSQTYNAAFSQNELEYVAETWRIVAEKFAPFDVDVTTEQPLESELNRSSSGDTRYGVRAVFTDDVDARPSACGFSTGCAGIAWFDVFDLNESGYPAAAYYEPAWVYTTVQVPISGGGSITFQQTAGQAADTAAHEIGHNLNLEHDGSPTEPDYYSGHDNWYPIMGSSNRAIAHWDDSTYPGATTAQPIKSDVATIYGAGLPAQPDDFTTEPLGAQTSYSQTGIIETRTDTDTFTINRTCTSPMTVSATGIGAGQSLDIKLSVTTPGGVTTNYDPASGADTSTTPDTPTGMDAVVPTIASPATGTWTFTIDGTGKAGSTGYSDYGSLGGYTLAISGCPTVAVPGPPASVTATPNARTTTGQVDWTAPLNSGGGPITGYTITGLPGGTVNLGNVLTYAATGLVPGTTYNVSVFAKNAGGTSASAATTTLKVDTWAPTTKPALTATLSGSTANLSWSAPANPGNATLTGWHVVGTGASPVDETVPATTFARGYPVAVGTTTYTVTGVYTATDTAGIVPSDSDSVTRAPGAPGAPASASTTPAVKGFTGTVNWTAPTDNGGSAITGYRITGLPGGTVELGNVLTYGAVDLVPGTTYNLTIAAKNSTGYGATRATTLRVATWAPTEAPTLSVSLSGTTATLTYAAPANPGKATLTGWRIDRTGPGTNPVDKTVTSTTTTMAGLAPGTHTFTVRPQYSADNTAGVQTSPSRGVVVRTKPSAPRIGTASNGTAGRPINAIARWAAPVSTGNSAINGYRVYAYKLNSRNQVVSTKVSTIRPASARSLVFPLAAGRYKFRVSARNALGWSAPSGYSRIVASR